ncbi:hypothetical protein K7432_016832 [Basidiobolus ranarum]|uniref:Cytochrome P450 n=1 Tax=Basidiobolus ranarum TaxID=34480 RepID=A0ABR2VME0_9FUNG
MFWLILSSIAIIIVLRSFNYCRRHVHIPGYPYTWLFPRRPLFSQHLRHLSIEEEFQNLKSPIIRVGYNTIAIRSTTMADIILYTLPKSPYYEGLKFLSITSLLITRDRQTHRAMRRQIKPVFTTKSLSLSEHLFTECTVAWCKLMVKAAELRETFDMTRLC